MGERSRTDSPRSGFAQKPIPQARAMMVASRLLDRSVRGSGSACNDQNEAMRWPTMDRGAA
jgi:hypothetical protein